MPRTLVVPAVSMGNVCQLAVDLVVLNATNEGGKVGMTCPVPAARLVSEHVEPVATADALSTDKLTGGLSTAVELFYVTPTAAALQIRSLVVPGHSRALAEELAQFAATNGFDRILVLAGASAASVPHSQRQVTRWIADVNSAGSPDLLALSLSSAKLDAAPFGGARLAAPLEMGLDALDFTGLLKPLMEACARMGKKTDGSPALVCDALVRFVFEGDNRLDGHALASVALAALGLGVPPGEDLSSPFSWRAANS